MAGRGQDVSSSLDATPSSLLGARNPQLSLDLSNAGPPPPALVFHPAEADAGSEPQSPVSPSPSRSRVIRFKSRVHIASSSRPRHSYTSATAGSSGARTRSASPESRRDSDSDSDRSEAESDSSSISAPLRDDAHRSAHEPPSPMPTLPAPQAQPTATYVVLGPAYGWSEHTPLIPKRFLRPQRARSSSHYGSDAELNAELARAQAAAKRTEEDVRCSHMKDGWRSGQWWWWKIRQELCCCCADDDDEDE